MKKRYTPDFAAMTSVEIIESPKVPCVWPAMTSRQAKPRNPSSLVNRDIL